MDVEPFALGCDSVIDSIHFKKKKKIRETQSRLVDWIPATADTPVIVTLEKTIKYFIVVLMWKNFLITDG